MIPPRRRMRPLAIAVLGAIATACGEEVVVRTTTRVEPDGGVSRRSEITGTDENGAKPAAAGWLLDSAKVRLARRERWARVDESPGRIAVEGFFPTARDLPPLLSHATERGFVEDRSEASLSVEDLVVLERRIWRETGGDPYGPAEVSAALDRILALARRALESELRAGFGNDLDLAPVDRFLTTKIRPLAVDLLPSIRRWKTGDPERPQPGRKGWREVLAAHHVPIADSSADLFAGENLEAISAWMRRGVAAAVSTRARPIDAVQLSFWPAGDDAGEEAQAIARRAFGDAGADAAAQELATAAASLAGFYGDPAGARFRFETRLVVPGRLLRTNGTPDRDGVVWLHRDEDLEERERVFEAETVELRDEALRALGARRDLDPIRLVQLTDLLAGRDPDSALRGLLATAVARGRLSLLREEEAVPEGLRAGARELADLLDPGVESVPFP